MSLKCHYRHGHSTMKFKCSPWFVLFLGIQFLVLCDVGRCAGPPTASFSVADEENLRKTILAGYNPKIRPNGITIVNLIFNLLTINELETRTQTFSVSGYFLIVWEDSRLKWNPANYSGVGFVFSDETELWRPALVVRNAVDDLSVIADEDVPFRVNEQGQVAWTPPGIYQTNCDIDTTYYPFDSQICSVEIQSWGYNLRELNLTAFGNGVDTSEFQKNGEWELTSARSQRTERVDGADANTYATMTFEFHLERRTAYYGLNIILPVIVLSLLSGLVFVLPSDSGEKMGYSLTVLLSFAVFLTLISDRMPTTSHNTSYMAVYLSVTLCMCGISVLLTMIVLDLHFREDKVPDWIQSLTRRFFMPFVCIRGCKRSVRSADVTPDEPPQKTKPKRPKQSSDNPIWSGKNNGSPTLVRSDSEEEIAWKEIARVLDAMFFRFYMLAIVLITVVFFVILGVGGGRI